MIVNDGDKGIDNLFLLIQEYRQQLPIDVYGLIEELGIGLNVTELGDSISGIIEKTRDGRYLIYVNSSDSDKRKRFTIAHELGHYVFHRNQIDERRIADNRYYRRTELARYNNKIGNIEETQANKFAVSLLMPLHLIHDIKKNKTDLGKNELIKYMANEFIVSEKAMRIYYDVIFPNENMAPRERLELPTQ